MYLECSNLSAIGRLLYTPPAILGWVKNGAAAVNRLWGGSARRMKGARWRRPAAVVAETDGSAGWTLRSETAAKIPFSGDAPDCRKRSSIAATAMRCMRRGFSWAAAIRLARKGGR